MELQPIICVCKFCGHSESEKARIEVNFRDSTIYYVCVNCKKTNKLDFRKAESQPLPRARIM